MSPPNQSWDDIGRHLMDQIPYARWRRAMWLPVPIAQDGVDARLVAYQLVEHPHTARIESAIAQWLAGQPLPRLAGDARRFLILRFHVVGFLLCSFHRVLPPPPPAAVPTIYRQFLLTWWRQVGANYAVGFTCAEDAAAA